VFKSLSFATEIIQHKTSSDAHCLIDLVFHSVLTLASEIWREKKNHQNYTLWQPYNIYSPHSRNACSNACQSCFILYIPNFILSSCTFTVMHNFPTCKLETPIRMEFCINTGEAYANTKKLSY
jgi:hypothetical protein